MRATTVNRLRIDIGGGLLIAIAAVWSRLRREQERRPLGRLVIS